MSRLTGYEVDGDVITTAVSTVGTAITVVGSIALGSLARLAIYRNKQLKPQYSIALAYKARKHATREHATVGSGVAGNITSPDQDVNQEVSNG
jgi:hypothetical protein